MQAKANPNLKIKKTIQTYVDGYLNADTRLIKKAFNKDTRLYSVDVDKIDITEMADWLVNLADRRVRGDIRQAQLKIAFIDITENTAVAKIHLYFAKQTFTDYLSLLNIQDEWIIVGKVYSAKTTSPAK